MDGQTIKLSELLDFERLEALFRHFYSAFGLDVALYDASGGEMLSKRDDGTICTVAGNCGKCRQSVAYGAQKAFELGEPYIYTCGCGLILCSSPIIYQQRLAGSVALGPVMLWEADEYAEKEWLEKTADLPIADADGALLSAVKSVGCAAMASAAQILFIVVNTLSGGHSEILRQHAEIARQQAQISELILEKKLALAHVGQIERHSLFGHFAVQAEKELIAYIQTGNRSGARKVLNEYLGEVFTLSGGNIDQIKAKLYELFAFLSRAAVESGAPLKGVERIAQKTSRIVAGDTDYETLCYLTAEGLEGLITLVYDTSQTNPQSRHLSNAIAYILANYGEELTLTAVAKAVYVSGCYLSHLFREEMGVTFSDYVCRVRIDKAKEMLKERGVKIQEVAGRVGFYDANYFAKMFKKMTGATPKEYQSLV
ncbi:MAG: PocR ligand-binding domain-containing protein [Clostridiales bacterium]|nr:PocR ligand-binding domain-containing protein [Clostridiales bacterium]